jgi:hypothetical protein
LENAYQAPAALPLLKATMTRLVWRIAPRQIVPGGTGAQYPQNTVQDGARVLRRPAASIGTSAMTKQRLEDFPLSVSQVHAVEYDGDGSVVTNLIRHF